MEDRYLDAVVCFASLGDNKRKSDLPKVETQLGKAAKPPSESFVARYTNQISSRVA